MNAPLGEAYPKEQARLRVILGHYKEIGLAGCIGVMLIESSLQAADEAAISGDVAAMIAAFEDMQTYTG